MDIFIREIEEKDYPAITTLFVNEILGNNNSYDDYSDSVVLFFSKIREDKKYKTFVALFDNNVVGFISVMSMLWIMSENIFIQCFAVRNEYQNKGIGAKLIKYIEDYAKVKGIAGVGLQSGVQRVAAHTFYEHNGYIKSNYFYKNFDSTK